MGDESQLQGNVDPTAHVKYLGAGNTAGLTDNSHGNSRNSKQDS